MTSDKPLEVNEIISLIKKRWGVTYELIIISKGKSLYLQMMWGFLEKQSFHLTDEEYRNNLAKVLEIVQRLGQSTKVRTWLLHVNAKPNLGRALSLPLKGDWRREEFVL